DLESNAVDAEHGHADEVAEDQPIGLRGEEVEGCAEDDPLAELHDVLQRRLVQAEAVAFAGNDLAVVAQYQAEGAGDEAADDERPDRRMPERRTNCDDEGDELGA